MLVLHETLLVPVYTYGSETVIWKKERCTIRAVQMDNLRGLLGVRRIESRIAWIREFCGVMKGVGERIDEGVLRWFGHMERMEFKRVYLGVCW